MRRQKLVESLRGKLYEFQSEAALNTNVQLHILKPSDTSLNKIKTYSIRIYYKRAFHFDSQYFNPFLTVEIYVFYLTNWRKFKLKSSFFLIVKK